MKRVTKEQIEAWLGDELCYVKILSLLAEVANGDYGVEEFRADVLNYEE